VKRQRHPLGKANIGTSADWIAAQQRRDGEIPWLRQVKGDPWDHIHSAMGLTVAGRFQEAVRAYRFSADTQTPRGGWPSARTRGRITDSTQETNHAGYFATGIWHYFVATESRDFLAEMWPTVEASIDLIVSLQEDNGTISWALAPDGRVWREPLLTGSSSIHGGLVCAERIACELGFAKPSWESARERLATALRGDLSVFDAPTLPESTGRYSMDWYYPVLGGALRGEAGRARLLDSEFVDRFLCEGVGIRCVADRPWYTVAETCELVLSLAAVGLEERAAQILSWMHPFRMQGGGYWTGRTHPEGVFWPEEHNAWTAATVLLAADALEAESKTSSFFRDLAGDDEAGADQVVASAS
jgi:hypothetical protein